MDELELLRDLLDDRPDDGARERARRRLDEVMRATRPGPRPAPAPSQARWRLRRRPPGRGLAIAVATLLVAGTATAAVVHLTAAPARSYDVARYLHRGDAFDCSDLASQALAQAILRADPSDPNRLDEEPDGITADRDGVACPQLPGPRDEKPVASIVKAFRCLPTDTRTARCPQPSRPFSARAFLPGGAPDVYDCKVFATQADAQAVLRYEPADPNDLDGDDDGIACPDRPAPRDLVPVAPEPRR